VPVELVLPGFGIRTGYNHARRVTVAGQPEVAAAWLPVNDHPIDKASYSFEVTVPNAYEVVATASTKSGGNATTEEFIAFAEQVSGEQLDDLFTTWLFTPAKPSLAGAADGAAALSAQAGASAADWWQRAQAQHDRGRF
jgi:aminopeptidase N